MITDLHLNVEYFNIFSAKVRYFRNNHAIRILIHKKFFTKVTRITILVIH